MSDRIRLAPAALYKYPEREGIVQWAERNFVLPRKSSYIAGPWRSAYTPHVVPILAAFCNPKVKQITLCWGSQCAKTTVLLIAMLWKACERPGPMTLIEPGQKTLKKILSRKIRPQIEGSHYIKNQLSGGVRSITLDGIEFAQCSVVFGLATSSPDTKSTESSVVFCDEVSEFPLASDRGDDVILALAKRLRTYPDGKLVLVSTPMTPDDVHWKQYLAGNQSKWKTPCPGCGVLHEWRIREIKWDKMPENSDSLRWAKLIKNGKRACWWECPDCGRRVSEDEEKNAMNAAGVWVADCPEIEDHLSAQGPSLMFRLTTLRDWAAEFIEAAHYLRRGDSRKMRAFKNNEEAAPFSEARKCFADEMVKRCCIHIPRGEMPKDATVFVYGCDVQHGEIYWHALAFRPLDNSLHVMDYGRAPGSPREIIPLLSQKTYGGKEFFGGFADAGDGTMCMEVYRVCESIPKWRPSQGQSMPIASARLWMESEKENAEHRGRLVLVNSSLLKDTLFSALRGGKITFCMEAGEDFEYLQQMSAWERTESRSGASLWGKRPGHEADHWPDSLIYAMALANAIGWEPGRIPQGDNQRAEPPEIQPATPEPTAPKPAAPPAAQSTQNRPPVGPRPASIPGIKSYGRRQR